MKTPNPIRVNGNSIITPAQAKKYGVGYTLVDFKVSEWNDLRALAKHALTLKRKNEEVTAKWSLNSYILNLSNISTKYLPHTALREFANKLKLYLQQDSVKNTYSQYFEEELLNKEARDASDQMEKLGDINAKKQAIVASKKMKRKLDEEIKQADNPISQTNQGEINQSTSSNTHVVQEPSQKKAKQSLSYAEIKQLLYQEAATVHEKYQANQPITPDERKLMSCGGSFILDLIDQSENSEFKKLFSDNMWNAITLEFQNKLALPQGVIMEPMLSKWKYAAVQAMIDNSFEDSFVYYTSIYSSKGLSVVQRKIIKFFMTIFDVVENNKYILQNGYKDNISEYDYLDQIWLPVLKALFSINGNLVRLKKGETITDESTTEKSKLYSTKKHIVGFKTDVRFIYDYNSSEFDIGVLEACLPNANDTKVTHDESKLLREGKSNTNLLDKVSAGEIDRSWIVQTSGTKAFLSTVNYVGHELYVGLLQSEIVFPSSISELNDEPIFRNFLQNLFQFRDHIEKSAHIVERKINQTNSAHDTLGDRFHDNSPRTPPHQIINSEAQTWYTPPKMVRSKSVFPLANDRLLQMGSHIVIDEDDSGSLSGYESEGDAAADDHGFIKLNNEWYHVATGASFEHHPYH